MQAIGNIFEDAWGAVEDVADAIAHPADSLESAWDVVVHPADSIEAFANGLVDVLHIIPGMDEAGELLKDFANTAVGEWCLRIMATYGYYVMAPYLGAQLASVSFALPGVAKAEPFLQSWISETIDRVIKTIGYLIGQNFKVGDATNEALNKLLASNPAIRDLVQNLTAQTTSAIEKLKTKLGEDLSSRLETEGESLVEEVRAKLADEYGVPPDFEAMANDVGEGIREDCTAAAYDLLAKTHYQSEVAWDPATGKDVLGDIQRSIYGAKNSSVVDASLYSNRGRTAMEASGRTSVQTMQTSIVGGGASGGLLAAAPAAFAPSIILAPRESKASNLFTYGVAGAAAFGIAVLFMRKRKS